MTDLKRTADILEKAAAYIDELEAKVSGFEAKIKVMEEELTKSADERDSHLVSALKEKGFSDNDITNLRSLPKETIEKIAHQSEEAWDLGSAAGKATGDVDAITAFCLS